MPFRMDRPLLDGLFWAFLLGLGLLGLHLLSRVCVPLTACEAYKAARRLWGGLFLTAVAWYARFVLFPTLKWQRLWWFLWPILILVIAVPKPVLSVAGALAAAQKAVLAFLYLSLLEKAAAALRRPFVAGLGSAPERQSALYEAHHLAPGLCFLAALTIAPSLFLLSLDYLFDYFWYGIFGSVLVFAVFLVPPAVLGARLRGAVHPLLLRLAEREEEAFIVPGGQPGAAGLEHVMSLRSAILETIRIKLDWWEWLCPLGSSFLLIFSAMICQ